MVSFSGDIVTFEIKDREAFGSDYEEAHGYSSATASTI